MLHALCAVILVLSALADVKADLFQRFKTKIPVEDIVRTIPMSTSVTCALSCKESLICKQPALSDANACLHLKREFTKSIDVELFEPVQHPPPFNSGKNKSMITLFEC